MALSIHDCLIKIEKRAERAADDKLLETFVDAAPLYASIDTVDHQVIFGRRGTGKTHILKYLADDKKDDGDISIFLDLRTVGSNNSLYTDRTMTLAQRATPLLIDVLIALHDGLLSAAIDGHAGSNLSIVGSQLDDFAAAISQVAVIGDLSVADTTSSGSSDEHMGGAGLSIDRNGPALTVAGSFQTSSQIHRSRTYEVQGRPQYYVRFGDVQSSLRKLSETLTRRIYLILDEWSEIPLDIQPYLADLLRRCVLPLQSITVKIAAIEHRSNFSFKSSQEYVGIELGADAGADVNLDDFMVFDNDSERSKAFFADLLFKHYRATDGLSENEGPRSVSQFISEAFTQVTALEELVRAVEGVPRDAVYLAATVARKAYNRKIGVQDVRSAARDWYQRDKSTPLRSDRNMADLLQWLIDQVIAHRRARAFLLPAHQRHSVIESLFDARLLHVLKRNISSNEQPGVRYDVYKLDYGCYVDLIATKGGPSGLLPTDEGEYAEVPPDDYRSIRRAILDLDLFERRDRSSGNEA